MAIRLLSPMELAERVREVRRRLGMGSVALSLALGEDKQYISRIEKAQRKRIDRAEKVKLAEFAAGKADFHATSANELLHYLEGEIDWQVNLVPSVPPADGGLDSSVADSDMGRYLTIVAEPESVIAEPAVA